MENISHICYISSQQCLLWSRANTCICVLWGVISICYGGRTYQEHLPVCAAPDAGCLLMEDIYGNYLFKPQVFFKSFPSSFSFPCVVIFVRMCLCCANLTDELMLARGRLKFLLFPTSSTTLVYLLLLGQIVMLHPGLDFWLAFWFIENKDSNL